MQYVCVCACRTCILIVSALCMYVHYFRIIYFVMYKWCKYASNIITFNAMQQIFPSHLADCGLSDLISGVVKKCDAKHNCIIMHTPFTHNKNIVVKLYKNNMHKLIMHPT